VKRAAVLLLSIGLTACAHAPDIRPAQPAPVAPVVEFDVDATPIATPTPPAAPPSEATLTAPIEAIPPPPRIKTLQAYLDALSAVSCPAGAKPAAPQRIGISAKGVSLQTLNPARKTVGELTFVAGYHLTSPDPRFGGLSGLDVLDDGNLLAVSDVGDLVWIDLGKDGLTPVAGRIASLRDAAGTELRGKADGDAEGLAVNGGMALVSFERNHRVLAYDIGKCGAAARGAPIMFEGFGRPLPTAFAAAQIAVDENRGAEALAVTPDWMLLTGLETLVEGSGPLSARAIEAPPVFDLRVESGAPEFVGLDVITDGDRLRAFSLHRSTNPLDSNAITISETDFVSARDQTNLPRNQISEIAERAHDRIRKTATRRLAELNIWLTIDNFEGIAARRMPDGHVRLYVISDDNFKSSQRTLLFVFDLGP
jgi:hypothetical protein